MIYFKHPEKHILTIKCIGKLTDDDVEQLKSRLTEESDTTRDLLISLEDFEGYDDSAAFFKDIKLETRYRNAFSRIACLTGSRWEKWFTNLAKPFTSAKVKIFNEGAYLEALQWLQGDQPVDIEIDENKGIVLVAPGAAMSEDMFETIRSTVDEYLEQHKDSVLTGLIIHTRSFPGWESLRGMTSHLRFVRDMHTRVKRVAIVSDTRLKPVLEHVASHFVAAEVEGFAYDGLDEARAWIQYEHKTHAQTG